MTALALCAACTHPLPAPDALGCPRCGVPTPRPPARLSPDQEAAIVLLDSGRNVLLTGPAGTGKSWTLGKWLEGLEARRDPRAGRVAVTASTGAAAVLIGGRTVHSWVGAGMGDKTAEQIASDPEWGGWWRHKVAPRIREARVLVIDEASQINGKLLALISDLCKLARSSGGFLLERDREGARARGGKPFGGLQVVLVGDMGQLEPVEAETGFPFETEEWWDAEIHVCELTTVHRQEDQAFVRVLGEIRHGHLSDEGRALLESRVRAFDPDADPPAVRLANYNASVDSINDAKLEAIPGDMQVFPAIEEGDATALATIDKSCLSPRDLYLKAGARVMFTRNDPSPDGGPGRFVNGTLGTVTWMSPEEQGGFEVTTDRGVVVCPDRFLWQWGVEGGDIYVPEKWTKKLVKRREAKKGEGVRLQFPVKLAWAISTHKSQGQTIDRVSVNLKGCFANGQAYVALSRARSLSGLNIEDWDGAASVMAHPTAVAFIRGDYRPPDSYFVERGRPVPPA